MVVLKAINKVLGGKQRAIRVLETNISEVIGNAHTEELERVKQQIEKQQTLLAKMTAASEDYLRWWIKFTPCKKSRKKQWRFLFTSGIHIEIKG